MIRHSHEHKTCTNWISNMARILYIKNFMDFTWTDNAHKPSLHCKNTNVTIETVVSISWGNNSFIICRLTSTKEQKKCNLVCKTNLQPKNENVNKAPWVFFCGEILPLGNKKKRRYDLFIFWGKSVHISRGGKKVEITIFRP
jgi:hypothetical protein